MQLTPREKDKLLVAMAAIVARSRKDRGVKLNHPEAIALITEYVVEGARDGRAVADLEPHDVAQAAAGAATVGVVVGSAPCSSWAQAGVANANEATKHIANSFATLVTTVSSLRK